MDAAFDPKPEGPEMRSAETSWRGTPEKWLPWIVGGAFLLRVSMLLWWDPEIAADAADYVRMANDIARGRGFLDTDGDATSFRAPLYPLLLAAVTRFFGSVVVVARILQSGLDVITVMIVYWLADRTLAARLGAWVAPLAAGFVALNWAQIAASQRVLSETLFTVLFVAAVSASSAWWRSERPAPALQWAVATGFLLGLATLTRGVLIAYPFVLVAFAWVRWGRPPRGSGALLLCFVLTLAPWTLRNYGVHGAFVPVSTQVGITLYASYNPPGGAFGFQPSDAVVEQAQRLPEAMASRVLTRAAIDTAFANPKRTLRLEGLKSLYFWSPVDWELLPRYGTVNPTYLWIVLVALMGWCMAPVRKAFLRHWPLLLPAVYLFGMALVFHGSPRYRLPTEPLMAIAAAASAVGLATRIGRRRAMGLLLALVMLCGLATVYSDSIRTAVRPWVTGL